MEKGFIGVGSVVAFGLISNQVQSELGKWAPEQVSSVFAGFRYETGVTPLSNPIWPISLCTGYLVSLVILKYYMKNRQPWDLKQVRILHNAFLCFWSFLMLIGCLKETIEIGMQGGAEGLLCDSKRIGLGGKVYLWYYMFYVSKFYEFIDTYIILLRKKPTTFLHVFHHFITAILCWAGLYAFMPMQWLTLILNTAVHVAMYYYYLIQTLQKDVWWKKYITQAQIIQFVIDLIGLSSWWYYKLVLKMDCVGDTNTLIFATAILASFLVLFMNFFVQTYRKKPSATPKKNE